MSRNRSRIHSKRKQNYAELAEQKMSKQRRKQRPAAAVIDANNFVKSALLDMAVTRLPGDERGALSAMDACSGRGGDLHKFASQPRITQLALLDENEAAVRESERRWTAAKSRVATASFVVSDLASPDLLDGMEEGSFDIVTVHFALHYLFETTHQAYAAVQNICNLCRPGGLVIVTVPNEAAVRSFTGSDLVKIDWGDRSSQSARKYAFTMKSAVEDVEEWIVPKNDLTALFAEHGLEPEANMTGAFPDIYSGFVESTSRDFSCSVRNMRNRKPLSDDEGRCFSLYSAHTFRRPRKEPDPRRPPFGRRLSALPSASSPSAEASSAPSRGSSSSTNAQG